MSAVLGLHECVGSGSPVLRLTVLEQPTNHTSRVALMDIALDDDQSYNLAMKQIGAARFKEQCLSLLDAVDLDGIVITKRGKPVAKLIPFASDSASLIGSLAGKIKITGEILSTGVTWDAER